MIQPLQSNSISFKSAQLSPVLKAKVDAQSAQKAEVVAQTEAVKQKEAKKNFSISETYEKGKVGVVGFFKGINNITNVASGVTRGVVEGIGATAILGVVGKAVAEAKDEKGLKVIGHIVGQTVKDFAKGAWETIKFIPSVITKSPLENIKTISSLPKKFFAKEYAVNEQALKGYLSGHGKVAAIATAVGLGVLAFRTIQGKINANEKNADLDHKTNLGHV